MKNSKWIWKRNACEEDCYISFYERVGFNGKNTSVKLSCDGNYALYVNGILAGFGQYADFPHYKVYDVIDVTEYLQKGDNELKITVWHHGRGTLNYFQSTAGLCYAVYAEGACIARSDEETLCAEAAGFVQGNAENLTWQLGFTHKYDFRLCEGKLENAVPVSKEVSFIERPIKLLELTDTVKAVLFDSEKQIYDLGYECAGFLHIKCKIDDGKTLKIWFGEHLRGGEIPRFGGEPPYKREFVVKLVGAGKEEELLLPFRILGTRYFGLECDGAYTLSFLGLKEVLYPVQKKAFSSDFALRERIYRTAERTLRLCMHQHYDDCPWREQGYYSLDGRFAMQYGYYAYEGVEYQRAALALMSQGIRKDGMFPMCAPSSVEKVIPSFSLFFTVAVAEYYGQSKDVSLLEEVYENIRKNLDVHMQNTENGLLNCFYDDKDVYWNFYEWTDGLTGGASVTYKQDMLLNALFSMVAEAMCTITTALGKSAETQRYAEIKSRLNEKINERFYDAERKCYFSFEKNGQYHQLANAWAILCGAATGKRAEEICEILISDNSLIKTSLSMTAFVYDALILVDKEKYREYILRDIDGKFSKMLDCGATSFWETEKGSEDFDGAGSLCHSWSALAVKYYKELL